MGRENLQRAMAPAAEHDRCMPDLQIGFLLRTALQRHAAIFSARMIEGLTPTQLARLPSV